MVLTSHKQLGDTDRKTGFCWRSSQSDTMSSWTPARSRRRRPTPTTIRARFVLEPCRCSATDRHGRNDLRGRQSPAALCHGSGVLRSTQTPDDAPLVRGKSVTGFPSTEEEAVGLAHVISFVAEDSLIEDGGLHVAPPDIRSRLSKSATRPCFGARSTLCGIAYCRAYSRFRTRSISL